MKQFLKISLPKAPLDFFDYLPPKNTQRKQLKPGVRIKVPFRNGLKVGILLDISTTTNCPEDKLREAQEILDHEPVVSQSLIALCKWTASYYHVSLGDVLATALPSKLRQGAEIDTTEVVWEKTTQVTPEDRNILLGRAKKQQHAFEEFDQQKSIKQQCLNAFNINLITLKALENKGLIKKQIIQKCHQPFYQPLNADYTNLYGQPPLQLNAEQQSAIDNISTLLDTSLKNCPRTVLLHGVTGSGKTEVYLQLIAKVLMQKKQVLVLVPEIGLTPQTIQRFKKRFNVPTVLIHSGLTIQQRFEAWLAIKHGEAGILIGTRSAFFADFQNLGLIIVDEEHDDSYKQQDGIRHSVRDLAVYRGSQESIVVILGSATPSMESLHNAYSKRYHYITLNQRVAQASLPVLNLIDIMGHALHAGLSQMAIEEIHRTLLTGNQALVFINRRGYAPSLICFDCGWIHLCPHCDIALTVHHQPEQLCCHHCNYREPLPSMCKSCHSPTLDTTGIGSEQVELFLKSMFSNYPVYRVDSDSMRQSRFKLDRINDIKQQKPAILVGTQLLAKGHHFPKITCVVIINSDEGFYSYDFRGVEKTAQLITQVAGRAGRGKQLGQVFIQTYNPKNDLLKLLCRADYKKLANNILQHRQKLQLPPFGYLALFLAESTDKTLAFSFLETLRNSIQKDLENTLLPNLDCDVKILGPMTAPLEKKQGKYRIQLLIKSDSRKKLHQLLLNATKSTNNNLNNKKLKWYLDIDPKDLL